jgi:Tfp pilus assembly protein PilZ
MGSKVKLEKYNTAIARLLEIILSMSEDQQQTILNQAEALAKGDRRTFERKACHLEVDFATSDRMFKGFIKNISQVGVFISARAPVIIGEDVLMVFKVSEAATSVKLKGEVAHATRWGIGIEFAEKGEKFKQMVDNLIQQITP